MWKFAGFDDKGDFLLYNKDGEVEPSHPEQRPAGYSLQHPVQRLQDRETAPALRSDIFCTIEPISLALYSRIFINSLNP